MSLRFGIVGCGAIHATHAEALQRVEGVQLAGFYDVVSEKAKAAADKFGGKGYSSFKKFLDAVDAVNVCVPSGLHGKIGTAAAKAGKHVVIEKPIDVSFRAALNLVETCEAAGVKMTVISQHRFADDIRRVYEAAQGGEFGKLVVGDAATKWYRTQAYYDSGDWRGTWKLDGGGCLMNQGVHYIDMIQWIMGGVESVQAQMRTTTHRIEVEDVANALVTYKNGATGVIRGATSVYPGLAESLEVHGEFGTAVIEADRLKMWQVDSNAPKDLSPYGRGVTKQPTPKESVFDAGDKAGTGAADPTAIWGEQHYLQLCDFAAAIRENRSPWITGRDALEPLKVILAIYKSARQNGKLVRVDSVG